MTVIRLKEWEKSEPITLSEVHLSAFQKFKGKISIEASPTLNKYFIKATSWIGKFKIGNLTIDVVPKVGIIPAFKMLFAGDGEAKPKDIDSFNRVNNLDDFWEFLATYYLNIVTAITKSGFKKAYVDVEENSRFFRGQVLIVNDIYTNTPIRVGCYNRHSQLTEDIAVNQALLWGIQQLELLTSPETAQRLRFLSRRFESITPCYEIPQIDHKNFEGLYRIGLFIVNLIKTSFQTTSSTFGFSNTGLMLDMNAVFEGYVRNMIRQAILKDHLLIPDKIYSKTLFCNLLYIEPDFVVKNATNKIIAVCDCKYKEDWHFSTHNNDVYQMLAYLEGFSCKVGYIFYPSNKSSTINVKSIKFPHSGNLFGIAIPISQFETDTIWQDIGDLIKEMKCSNFD